MSTRHQSRRTVPYNSTCSVYLGTSGQVLFPRHFEIIKITIRVISYNSIVITYRGPSLATQCWADLLESVVSTTAPAELAVFIRAGLTGIPSEVHMAI